MATPLQPQVMLIRATIVLADAVGWLISSHTTEVNTGDRLWTQRESAPFSATWRINARIIGPLVLLLPLLGGCVVVPASHVTTSRSLSDTAVIGAGGTIAVLFSSDFAPETRRGLGEDMVSCVRDAVRDGVPGVVVASHEQFFQTVFPGLDREHVLLRADTLPALVSRPDLRQRIDDARIDYLVLVGARAEGEAFAGGLAPAPLAVGGWDKRVRMTATLFDLRNGAAVGSGTAEASGSVFFIAPLLIPLGGGVDPEGPACKALGAELVRVLRGAGEPRTR